MRPLGAHSHLFHFCYLLRQRAELLRHRATPDRDRERRDLEQQLLLDWHREHDEQYGGQLWLPFANRRPSPRLRTFYIAGRWRKSACGRP